MIKLLDLIEAKQAGPLYHFTSFDGLKGILESNTLKVGDDSNFETGGNPGSISLTRNKNLWYFPYRIELDGDKLSNNYKITPYQWSGGEHKSEWEESIDKDIKNIKSYITSIAVWVNREGSLEPKLEINQIKQLYPSLEFLHQDFKARNLTSDPNPSKILKNPYPND